MNGLLIASAPETQLDYVRELADQADYILCADGGLRHARALGLVPDLVIGDFDSGKRPDRGEVITLRPGKDDSDLMCCAREAMRRGCTSLTVCCASGGRIDHFLSNLSLLEYLYGCGIEGLFCDKQNRIRFHGGGQNTYRRDTRYQYVGIIPLDACLHGVTLTGLKYPLTDAEVRRDHVITISNEPIADEYTICIVEGRALVVECNG